MARKRKGSPRVELEITEADRATAIESNSGGCLIADALKRAGYRNPTVDMATIRFTDPETAQRFTYLTPPTGQHLLLGFDQGWPVDGIARVKLQRAVKVGAVTRGRKATQRRAERLAELEIKESSGRTLTREDKIALTRMRHLGAGDRPTRQGRAKITPDGTVVGGQPIPHGPSHPNLLRGRNRIYGAKLADPGRAFDEAVAAAVAERELAAGGGE